ncbi:MAG: GNAT family N-acetyltransferase [Chloroflexota bacterium]|nr:GNAT family N-acetyltransferase [Chloroflexota bacterium]
MDRRGCGVSGDFGEHARPPEPSVIRDATAADLPRLIELYATLAADPGQEQVGDTPAREYVRAFAGVSADPRQRLLVIEGGGRVVGTIVLVLLPNLSRRGRPYAIVENVVVDETERGRGYGAALMGYAIEEARKAGCYKIALTSRLHRSEAHRFYESLGFTAESKGFRLAL